MWKRQTGQIHMILCLDLLKAKDVRLLLLYQRFQYIVGPMSLFLTIFKFSRHGTDAIYVKADEFHFLVIFVERSPSIFNTIL
jgi:hypothetical protein